MSQSEQTNTEPVKALSDKHKLFVVEYVAHNCNGTKAYMAVYNSDEDTARVNASKLLTNTNIKAAVKAKIDEILQDKSELALRIVNEYQKLAFSDIKDIVNPATGVTTISDETDTSVIESVHFGFDKLGNPVKKYKLHDKKGALDSLSKFVVGFSENVELSGSLPVNIIIKAHKKEDENTGNNSTGKNTTDI